MKRWYLLLAVVVALSVSGCVKKAEARGIKDVCKTPLASIMNECQRQDEVEPNREVFDYGAYLHIILWEDEQGNVEVGNWNTWEINRGELTSLIGIKFYLNRATYQK